MTASAQWLRYFLAGCAAFCLLLTACSKTPSSSLQRKNLPNASGAPAPVPTGAAHSVDGIQFENVASSAGIVYRWPVHKRPMTILDTIGRGCAFFDFDNDGWQDILLVASPHVILYRNKGSGQFEDVSEATGLSGITGDWRGVAVGDYDGDGSLDLLLTGYHRLGLLRNDHGRGFIDVTTAAGLDPQNHDHWGSSAGFMDLSGTGKLDLVILNYVTFGPHDKQFCERPPGMFTGCPPDEYHREYGELWQNLGNGRFKMAPQAWCMKDTHGQALALAFADLDGDGRMDFYIGNDTIPADAMRNLGGMRFKNVAVPDGLAYGAMNHGIAAMGADWGDYDRDGRLDLIVTAFSDEQFCLFHNLGRDLFENTSDQTGLTGPTYKPLGFGARWIDVDNDGWPDLVFADGHVYDTADQSDPLSPFRQPMMLFHNDEGHHFTDLVPALGGDLAKPILGRGLASGDFDNDGKMDFLVVDFEGAPLLFHNISHTPHHWITLDLRGRSPNVFAYGAQVTAQAGKQIWASEVSPACSYLSSSDPRIHFGLGETSILDSIKIHWSDGHQDILRHVAADEIVKISESNSRP